MPSLSASRRYVSPSAACASRASESPRIDLVPFAAAFSGPMATRVIDQNAAHQLRGDAEEMSAVPPGRRLLIDQPKIIFVDQAGGLQSVIGSFALEITTRQAA